MSFSLIPRELSQSSSGEADPGRKMLNESQASLLSLTATRSPSVYDVIAQERMHSLLADSFTHLVTWLSTSTAATASSTSIFLATYKHELYALAHSLVECLFLATRRSLSTEHFFGMQRHPHQQDHQPLSSQLTRAQRLSSIVCAVCVPYFKLKLDTMYTELDRVTSRLELQQAFANAHRWVGSFSWECRESNRPFH